MKYIIAIVVGESTINIGCLFIVGSDVKGCEVVLVSDHRSINNETVTLTRNNTSAYGQEVFEHFLRKILDILYTIDTTLFH